MMNSPIIRPALPSDAPRIIDFQRSMALESEGLVLDPQILEQGVTAVFEDPGKGQYYVAEQEGMVIASLMITKEWSDWRNGMVWWIQSVYVRQENRRQGVFSKMFAYLLSETGNNPGIRGLRLYVDRQNTSAIRVYENLGMDGNHYRLFEWMKTLK